MNTIDARGYSCPQPVLMAKKAFTSNETAYTIIVDHPAAKENVSRFAKHSGFRCEITETDGEYTLSLSKEVL
jgi:tRNA 2-thiouridine synthesizing protein A